MTHLRKSIFILLIALACVAGDQGTKHLAKQYLQTAAPVSMLFDTVRLRYMENTGAFLSLGDSLSKEFKFWIFTVATSLFLLALTVYTFTISHVFRWKLLGLSMIVSSGFSNLADRIVNDGAVIDFLNLGIGNIRTGIFNLADFLIFTGIIILLVFHKPQ